MIQFNTFVRWKMWLWRRNDVVFLTLHLSLATYFAICDLKKYNQNNMDMVFSNQPKLILFFVYLRMYTNKTRNKEFITLPHY